MPMHEFTTGEVQAMRAVIATFVANRDDLIAAFMLTGGFHYLHTPFDRGVVGLVQKLEAVPLTHPSHEGLNASCPRAKPDLGRTLVDETQKAIKQVRILVAQLSDDEKEAMRAASPEFRKLVEACRQPTARRLKCEDCGHTWTETL